MNFYPVIVYHVPPANEHGFTSWLTLVSVVKFEERLHHL